MDNRITSREIVSKSSFFKEEDPAWGDIDLVHTKLIEVLEVYRKFLGHRINLVTAHDATSSKHHSEKSWHYSLEGRNTYSRAIDFFPDCYLLEAFYMALRMQFNGIGVYPYYEYKERGIIGTDPSRGMMHVDLRSAPSFRVIWYKDQYGEYNYVNNAKDFDNLISIIRPKDMNKD